MPMKIYVAKNITTGEEHPMQGKNVAGVRADIKHYIERKTDGWKSAFYFKEDWEITQVGRE